MTKMVFLLCGQALQLGAHVTVWQQCSWNLWLEAVPTRNDSSQTKSRALFF